MNFFVQLKKPSEQVKPKNVNPSHANATATATANATPPQIIGVKRKRV